MTVLEMLRELLRYPPEAEIAFTARTNGGELVPEQIHEMYFDLIDKGPDSSDPVIIRIVEAN